MSQNDSSATPANQILDSTVLVMRQEGPDQLTMGRVASKAGYSVSTLYRLFPSKESLLQGLAERELERMSQQLIASLSQYQPRTINDVEAGARVLIRAYIERFEKQSWLRRRIIRSMMRKGIEDQFMERMDMTCYSTVHFLINRSNGLTATLTRGQMFILSRCIIANVRTWFTFDHVAKNIPDLENDLVWMMMKYLRPDTSSSVTTPPPRA